MTPWICVLLITAAVPDGSANPPVTSPPVLRINTGAQPKPAADSIAETGRSPKKLRGDIRSALRTAATETGPAHAAAVRRLAALYVELSHDTQLPLEDRLLLGRTIRARLIKIKEQIARTRNRSRQEVGRLGNSAPIGDTAAQIVSALARGGHLGLTSTSGGHSNASSNSIQPAGALGGTADEGEALVELIQTTIAPGTWDISGGLGTIRYFSPLHAIVVRQTDEGHDLVGGVLNGLRD